LLTGRNKKRLSSTFASNQKQLGKEQNVDTTNDINNTVVRTEKFGTKLKFKLVKKAEAMTTGRETRSQKNTGNVGKEDEQDKVKDVDNDGTKNDINYGSQTDTDGDTTEEVAGNTYSN
jgi:hypothetical protein